MGGVDLYKYLYTPMVGHGHVQICNWYVPIPGSKIAEGPLGAHILRLSALDCTCDGLPNTQATDLNSSSPASCCPSHLSILVLSGSWSIHDPYGRVETDSTQYISSQPKMPHSKQLPQLHSFCKHIVKTLRLRAQIKQNGGTRKGG